MKMNIEKMIVALVIVPFALTSINTLIVQGGLLTREEAIEISRNSKLVQSLLEGADLYTLIQAVYSNTTQSAKGNKIWYIQWHIHPNGAPSAAGHLVTHEIDEETGEILYEGWLGLR